MNYHQAIDLLNKAKSFTGNENFEEIAKLLRLYEKSREASSFVFCAYPQSGDLYGKTLEEKTKSHLARTKEAIDMHIVLTKAATALENKPSTRTTRNANDAGN